MVYLTLSGCCTISFIEIRLPSGVEIYSIHSSKELASLNNEQNNVIFCPT